MHDIIIVAYSRHTRVISTSKNKCVSNGSCTCSPNYVYSIYNDGDYNKSYYYI